MNLTAEQITNERKKKGCSKAKLAREADMNPSTISLIESRRMNPYPRQLEKLAIALEIEVR